MDENRQFISPTLTSSFFSVSVCPLLVAALAVTSIFGTGFGELPPPKILLNNLGELFGVASWFFTAILGEFLGVASLMWDGGFSFFRSSLGDRFLRMLKPLASLEVREGEAAGESGIYLYLSSFNP